MLLNISFDTSPAENIIEYHTTSNFNPYYYNLKTVCEYDGNENLTYLVMMN